MSTKNRRFILIGLGQIGSEVLKRLPREFAVTCIALDPDAEEIVTSLKREDVEVIVGDATSRLVLNGARVDEADAVIVTTTSRKTNQEVARMLTEHFNPRRVIAVALTPSGVADLEALGVEVENVYAAGAMGIRNRIEHKSKAAHAIGLGKDEILEVEVHPNSRLANKPLGIIDPIKWKLGIIYRDSNIIVPRPDTVLKPRDKVIILGSPPVLKTVSEILTFSFQKFPLEYGRAAIVFLCGSEDAAFFDEVNYLFSVFPIEEAMIVRAHKAQGGKYDEMIKNLQIKNTSVKDTVLPAPGAARAAVADLGGEQGLMVVSGKALASGFIKRTALREMLSAANCPALIARSTFPYEKLAVPAFKQKHVDHVVETACEIASALQSEITAFAVEPSKYIAGQDDFQVFEENKKSLLNMGLIYKTNIGLQTLKGNPVKAVGAKLDGFNLLLTCMDVSRDAGWLGSILNPDVPWNVARRAPVSSLVLPPAEETL